MGTKIQGLLLVAVLGLSGISSTASAAPVVFTTNLGNFENPPTGSLGTGFATVTFDLVAHTMSIDASFTGLTGLTIDICINNATISVKKGEVLTGE